jgi:hypothetical protein
VGETIPLLLLTMAMLVIAMLFVVVFVLCRQGYAWKLLSDGQCSTLPRTTDRHMGSGPSIGPSPRRY